MYIDNLVCSKVILGFFFKYHYRKVMSHESFEVKLSFFYILCFVLISSHTFIQYDILPLTYFNVLNKITKSVFDRLDKSIKDKLDIVLNCKNTDFI